MHLVGFIIRVYHDARPTERQICVIQVSLQSFFKTFHAAISSLSTFYLYFFPSILTYHFDSTKLIRLLLLIKRYNSCRVLAFSTIFFHSRRSWASSDHFVIFIFLKSFLTSSSHLFLGLPTGRDRSGCHLYIFFTILVSGFLCICPNQLILY